MSSWAIRACGQQVPRTRGTCATRRIEPPCGWTAGKIVAMPGMANTETAAQFELVSPRADAVAGAATCSIQPDRLAGSFPRRLGADGPGSQSVPGNHSSLLEKSQMTRGAGFLTCRTAASSIDYIDYYSHVGRLETCPTTFSAPSTGHKDTEHFGFVSSLTPRKSGKKASGSSWRDFKRLLY